MAGVSRYARQAGKTFSSLARFSSQYRTVGCGSNVKAALERTQASAKNHPALAASADMPQGGCGAFETSNAISYGIHLPKM